MGVFITGATGSIGTEVVANILRTTEERIYVLIRAKNEQEATHRLKAFWYGLEELFDQIGVQIIPVAGDFSERGLGLNQDMRKILVDEVTKIFHIGAETGIQKSMQDLLKANVDGTKNMLAFAAEVNQKRPLERFVFVSTAYVAGRKKGRIFETDAMSTQFATYYEQSKAQAEILVQKSGLPYTICRPGMVVGNSKTGWTRNFNTVYYVLKLMLQGKMRIIPIAAQQKINIAPVDYVADAIVRLSFIIDAENQCFHLTIPDNQLPTAKELADCICRWAEKELQISISKPIFLSLPFLKNMGFFYNKKEGAKKKSLCSNLLALMPYFYDEHIFDRTNTDRLLGSTQMDWKNYIDTLLHYAVKCNFLHQTDRNVFEQVLYRLKSTTAPISYFDIKSSEEICETNATEMTQKIEKIVQALKGLNIQKGDTVALTGNNCTDYFALDIAIGLVGAVSVPIYYTTPIEEVELLLAKSKAKWFFVGDRRMMQQIDRLRGNVSVVVFSNALELTKNNDTCLSWDEFLLGTTTIEQRKTEYINPDDLATIRFTSGTTGEPKGVMFNIGQLSWMGQVMTELLPWKAKQKEMRYLSFLPLSHVVEGILASYAPYYMHCPVKFYYLNDFDRLTEALPKVRPTVFFSVPRFYEKLWQQIENNKIIRFYLKLPESLLKKMFGRLLKNIVLKKAGLDCCSQLIVGSAPISEELLNKFKKLGVEIYNAYGQTEAPLITINRMGNNTIPSIGTPLPNTKITVKEDGEIVVEGPQVCLGYYGMESSSIKNGVLLTGDLGTIDEHGNVFLHGRKKEMIITSYGKNINCQKVEEGLKNIPGITEAVLIGENRPYCTALLWIEENVENLEAEIEKLNKNLSHPEQIKKWSIISTPLSIQNGELTPNLKIKRNVVQEHYRDNIRRMYEK